MLPILVQLLDGSGIFFSVVHNAVSHDENGESAKRDAAIEQIYN
jgi:hypothetical protein